VKANQDLDFLVEEAKNILPEDFYVDELKILSEEIIVFLFYCAENANLKQQLNRKNELQLMDYLKEQAPEFRTHRQLE
jgi:predicted HicB family RNase H-like nuclease